MGQQGIDQHITNLMKNPGEVPIQQAAAVRAREAQLAAESNRLSRVWEDDPNNMEKRAAADQARNVLSQFHAGPVARVKSQGHNIFMSLQGELPYDLGAFNGHMDKWMDEVGSEPSPKVQDKMRKMAKEVRDTDEKQTAAEQAFGKEIAEDVARNPSRFSEGDMDRYLDEKLTDIPCRTD
jgi:hypothetical protein